MSKMLPLSKQTIAIAGASAGIGAALAESLAKQFSGIRLILTARRQDRLEQVADRCRQTGADVLVIPCDLSDLTQVQALARKIIEKCDRIDALINNAGYGQMGPIELISPEAAKHQFAVNFHAPLTLIQALIPVMRQQGGGRIINISSLGGRMAFPGGGLYSCSKFALEALSDVLRMELTGFNIQTIVVEPGPVVTEFFKVASEKVHQFSLDSEHNLYQPVIEKIDAIDRQLSVLGWTPEKVANVIIKALRDRHPRPRYLAATGGNIFVPLMTKVMPTWFTDTFWKRFYGIDKVEKNWKQTSQAIENAEKLTADR
jgi:short-subunit dehydrogenase